MTKQRQLVLQHLEDVSWRVMQEYPQVIKGLIRGRSGIYVLYSKDKLYYVGLANNLMGRLKTHLKDRHHGSWDRFSVYLTVLDEHMKELESLLLRIIKPRGNKAGGRFAKSLNLRLSLYRQMKDFDADRWASLLGGRVARQRRRLKARRGKGLSALVGAVDRPTPLRARYRGATYAAKLKRDGTIRYQGRIYSSPTRAAYAVTHTTVNGWQFWSYRAGSKWVPLANLRR